MPISLFTDDRFSSTIQRLGIASLTVLVLLNPISVFGGADDCNINVMCKTDTSPNQRAVAKYVVTGTNEKCTGTLLNNTKMDHTPYFATAHHCFVNPSTNQSVKISITWLYQTQTSTCTPFSPPPPNPNNSIEQKDVVADIVAVDMATDFILLKLKSAPPSDAYYAGWDIGGAASSNTLGIHHPQGELKAVSLSKNPLTQATYTETQDGSDPGHSSTAGNHWRVDWDNNGGTTEKGSSGSCLFDASTGRCIGALHGEFQPSCKNGNTLSYYGKLSETWKNVASLKTYLDPKNTITGGTTGIEGDTHITTTNGVHYDFQSAGEFISLRDPSGLEIQTRQTPIPTASTVTDSHSELPVCVSINTAVAARVGGHRVSYQSMAGSTIDPNSLELFVDGATATVGPNGLELNGGGRLVKTQVPGGLEFDFPDGSVLFATPNWWPDGRVWYFNINLTRPLALDGADGASFPIGGVAGSIDPGDWLPRLPDGSSMGPRPGGLQERYIDLYQKFADAWRVTNESSLFTYAPGTSTESFTMRSWPPPMNSPCVISYGQVHGAPTHVPVKSVKLQTAINACTRIIDKHARQNCVSDTQVTGDLGFAKVYRFSERAIHRSSRTTVSYDITRVDRREQARFTATVSQARAAGKNVASGSVQFMVDGRKVGKPVALDKNGQAIWSPKNLDIDKHEVSASYIPDQKEKFLPSMSKHKVHKSARE